MNTRTRYYIFRLFSLPKQMWNYFCGENSQPYANWHSPNSYIIFIRIYLILIFWYALLFTFTGDWWIHGKEAPLEKFESLYFSIVTITTLGYGDVAPRTGFQKLLVVSEVISGIVVFGALLVWLGQSISNRQHDAFQEQEKRRRERPLAPTFLSIAKALTEFLDRYDSTHPNNKSATDFQIYYYGEDSVFAKSNYFSSETFVETSIDLNKVEQYLDIEFWIDGLEKCSTLVKNARDEANLHIDDEELIQLLDNFFTSEKVTKTRLLDIAPNRIPRNLLFIICEEYANHIENANDLRNALFGKASRRANYQSMKYVGGIIEEQRNKALHIKRELAPFKTGRKLGIIWRKLFLKLQ